MSICRFIWALKSTLALYNLPILCSLYNNEKISNKIQLIQKRSIWLQIKLLQLKTHKSLQTHTHEINGQMKMDLLFYYVQWSHNGRLSCSVHRQFGSIFLSINRMYGVLAGKVSYFNPITSGNNYIDRIILLMTYNKVTLTGNSLNSLVFIN